MRGMRTRHTEPDINSETTAPASRSWPRSNGTRSEGGTHKESDRPNVISIEFTLPSFEGLGFRHAWKHFQKRKK